MTDPKILETERYGLPQQQEGPREQCALCLGYFSAEQTEQPILCKECLDKAACYDLAEHDRKFMLEAIQDVVTRLEIAEPDYEKSYAIGVLRGVLNCCQREKEGT